MGPVSRPVERCDTCEFYERVDTPDTEEGFCRCHPPTPWFPELGDSDEPEAWIHPPVFDYGWCGEWQAIESTT